MSALTNEQTAIRDMTRRVRPQGDRPVRGRLGPAATVPVDAVRKAGALGLFGVCIPPEWGGPAPISSPTS